MNILHINTFSTGGAANAALNLHKGLIEKGVNSSFLYFLGPEINIPRCYRVSISFDFFTRILFKFKLKKHFWEKESKINQYKKFKDHSYTLNYSDFDLLKSGQRDMILNADIIHLHWINYTLDFNGISGFKNKKLVWTLHDMNPFTGGCHYAYDCEGYKHTCNDCPQLLPPLSKSLAQKELQDKKGSIKNKELTIVALNQWMYELSVSSFLFKRFKHVIIPNSIDTSVFKYLNRSAGNNENFKKVPAIKYGYVATYHSALKGNDIFLGLVNFFKEDSTIEFVYIGKEFDEKSFNLKYNGNLNSNETLAEFYNSIDFLLVPSRGDNMPNVIIEALCCGVPVICSDVGGIPELISNENGIIMKDMQIKSWAHIIKKTLEYNLFNRSAISETAIGKYSQSIQSDLMIQLYKNLVENN
ncbi:MAG: glycosyltransferase [Cytophaga sp.]|uniref:glycosyltransferase n=1 Tax=Cytophaga sp. TaxID=29535 RepID=UPI003F801938